MFTPIVGAEQTLSAESPFAIGVSNASPQDVFESVLQELLDTDPELPAYASVLPMPLPAPIASSDLQATREGMATHLETGALTSSQPVPMLLVVDALPPQGDANPTDTLIGGSSTEFADFLPAGATDRVERFESDFVMEIAPHEASSQATASPPPPDGDEGVSPVLSARQGETLPSPSPAADAPEPVLELRRSAREDLRDAPSHAFALHGASAAPAAAPAELSHAITPDSPNWNAVEQAAQYIERLAYDRERDSITVRLDPPELGVIELRVQAQGNEVQAWVSAERDFTRQLLQQAQQHLREQLESRGLQLTHFDVGGQGNSPFAQAHAYRAPAAQRNNIPHPSAATDSLRFYDGRWSVWV
ncbi:MAG: flagellar hook-length control protein FliK [bacterium]|nr:flagellar hook-length control protein FliK [bacterium]